jgi:hypothetical protein
VQLRRGHLPADQRLAGLVEIDDPVHRAHALDHDVHVLVAHYEAFSPVDDLPGDRHQVDVPFVAPAKRLEDELDVLVEQPEIAARPLVAMVELIAVEDVSRQHGGHRPVMDPVLHQRRDCSLAHRLASST